MSKSLSAIRYVLHVIPIGAAIALLVLNAAGYYYKLEAEIPQVPAGAHAQNLYSYTLLQAVQALNEKQALNCFDCDPKYN